MTIRIQIQDEVTQRLEAFGKNAGTILDRALLATGYRYRSFIKSNYLSGQMLRKRTGAAQRSISVRLSKRAYHLVNIYTPLANIYEHGAVIRPKQRLVLRFPAEGGFVFSRRPIVLRRRPFMSYSEHAFNFQEAFNRSAEEEIAKGLAKYGLGQ